MFERMDSIIRLDSRGKVVFQAAATKLVPQLSKLDEKQIRYLVLAYDVTNTLFKQQPRSTWRKHACQHVFGHDRPESEEKKKAIVDALEFFEMIVYDENRELKSKFLERKRDLQNKMLLETATPGELKNTNSLIAFFNDRIKEIDDKITTSDEEIVLAQKGQKLSLLEKYSARLKRAME